MFALLEIALFSASLAAIMWVFTATLLPAMPRIVTLLATGRDPGFEPVHMLPVRTKARTVRAVRVRTVAPLTRLPLRVAA